MSRKITRVQNLDDCKLFKEWYYYFVTEMTKSKLCPQNLQINICPSHFLIENPMLSLQSMLTR